MGEQRTTVIRLAPGMTETLPGGLRTSLHIRSGRVSIRFPAEWLAESVVAREQVLIEGDRQSLASVSRVEATALVATEVLLIREAGLAITLCAQAAERMRRTLRPLRQAARTVGSARRSSDLRDPGLRSAARPRSLPFDPFE